jgi:hypothetical protein
MAHRSRRHPGLQIPILWSADLGAIRFLRQYACYDGGHQTPHQYSRGSRCPSDAHLGPRHQEVRTSCACTSTDFRGSRCWPLCQRRSPLHPRFPPPLSTRVGNGDGRRLHRRAVNITSEVLPHSPSPSRLRLPRDEPLPGDDAWMASCAQAFTT